MSSLVSRQVPPWELRSRISYRRWKDRRFGRISSFKHLYNSYKTYEGSLLSIQNAHTHQGLTIPKDSSLLKNLNEKLNNQIGEICIGFQYLANTPLGSNQRKLCLGILKSVDSSLSLISSDSLFKFLVSYSRVINSLVYLNKDHESQRNYFNLKLSSHEICKRLFRTLEERLFEVNSDNIVCLIESYIRLCVGYGQDCDTFCKIYKDSISMITSSKFSVSETDLDKILLNFDRMGIYDKDFVIFYSRYIRRFFHLFNENQVSNFCRYMTKIPFVDRNPLPTHIDLLKLRGKSINFENELKDKYGLEYSKRLPRYYVNNLLNRRNYQFKPKVNYSSSLSENESKEILKGWDFVNSSFIKGLNKKLPYVLHQYTYFNLIDIAEMFYVYGIQSELIPRFSTELWKYLYTLKYGYPLKSIIVLSCLKQGDSITFGRLVRNVPSMLSFNWPPEMVAECLISCGSLGIKIYNKLSQYLEKRILYFRNSDFVCRIFESLSLSGVPQFGLYSQMVTLSESFPGWLHLKHLILIAKSCSTLGMLENRLFRLILSNMNQVYECSFGELIPILNLSKEIKLNCEDSKQFYRFILKFLESLNGNESISYDELIDLLEGMVSIQVRTPEFEKVCVRVLRSTEDVNVIKIIKYLSILGKVESRELMEVLTDLVSDGLKDFDEFQLSSLIWDMISIGFNLESEILLRVVKKFNQLKPTNFNTHLLSVVGSLIRLSDSSNNIWREFLKIIDEYRDYSWSRSPETTKIIKSVANTIKDSKTFVQQFPYTIDISAEYTNIDTTHVDGSNISGDTDKELLLGEYLESTKPHDSPKELAMFYYSNQENPFILHVKPDGTHENHFNFYCQTRKRILQSMGWKDTLMFSPNT